GRQARRGLLRLARFRSAAGELGGDRQGRHPIPPLVPARASGRPDRAWRSPDLLVRIDVRISDAVSGDARAGRQSDRADEPSYRPPADFLWRRAWLTVGHLRI